MEEVSDSRYEEVGCLDPREMVEVDSGVNGDVASKASADASQGESYTRGYVAETPGGLARGRAWTLTVSDLQRSVQRNRGWQATTRGDLA